MNLDEQLYRIPLFGSAVKRLYTYFKRNTFITDFIHIVLGLSIGLIVAGGELFIWGVIALTTALLGHVYAFAKGDNS